MSCEQTPVDLLLEAGRRLLENGEMTAEVHAALQSTARALGIADCQVVASYSALTVALAGSPPAVVAVRTLGCNSAVQIRVHQLLDSVRSGAVSVADGCTTLAMFGIKSGARSTWLIAASLAAGAICLTAQLGGDFGAMMVAGFAAAIGAGCRFLLSRQGASQAALPFTSTLIGGLAGGVAIRLHWTTSTELAVVVPALVVLPGVHLINGVLDAIEDHMPMAISRLGLAACLSLAGAAGLGIGIQLSSVDSTMSDRPTTAAISPWTNAGFAGLAAAAFAVTFQSSWQHAALAGLGGLVGNGLRSESLAAGCSPLVATTVGGLVIGALSAGMARFARSPIATIAFASAVTMIPGVTLYRGMIAALRIAQTSTWSNGDQFVNAIGNATQAIVLITGLSAGLIVGIRLASAVLQREGQQ